MKTRVITAILIIAVCVPAIWIGGIWYTLLATLFAAVACHEIVQLVDQNWPGYAKYLVYALFIGGAVACSLNPLWAFVIAGIGLIYLLGLLVWYETVQFEHIGIVYMVLVLLMVTISGIGVFERNNRLLTILLLIGTFVTDTFCLFGGMAFGKHKLNERISPKKTIEGSLSGWVVGFAASLIFALIFLKEENTVFVIACALLIPLVGQLGDLAFSAIKRHFKVKDFGTIFPGHGGVLDRVDSLTFTSTLMFILYIILVIWQKGTLY